MASYELVNGVSVDVWLKRYRKGILSRKSDDVIFREMYNEMKNLIEPKKIPMPRRMKGETQQQYDLSRVESSVKRCVGVFNGLWKEATDTEDENRLIALKTLFINPKAKVSKAGLAAINLQVSVLDIAEVIAEAETEERKEAKRIAEAKQLEQEATTAMNGAAMLDATLHGELEREHTEELVSV